MPIETPLLVVGRGPAAIVVAKVAAGCGVPCLLVGHEPLDGDEPVVLAREAVDALVQRGLLDVLRPYLGASDPPAIAPRAFEDVLKHHCVADVNVTVYDRMDVVERRSDGSGVRAVLTDGAARWDLVAERFVDADLLPRELSAAITSGVAAALAKDGAGPIAPR